MSRRIARILTAGLGSLLLCVAAVDPGETVYRCRYDHIARTTCCCKTGERAGMAAGGCCDIETYKLAPQVPKVAPHGGDRPAVTLAILAPPADRIPFDSAPAAQLDRRPRDGPTIVVLSHSFRI